MNFPCNICISLGYRGENVRLMYPTRTSSCNREMARKNRRSNGGNLQKSDVTRTGIVKKSTKRVLNNRIGIYPISTNDYFEISSRKNNVTSK